VRIGLTGPIGCGKSTVAGWLAARGAVVVDADALTREVMVPRTAAFDAIVARFGPRMVGPDGSLDRSALGRIVFADQAALRALEAIVHPAVRPLIVAAVAVAEGAGAAAVVIEAIKLVEAGYARECDEVWLVTCPEIEQRARLRARGATDGEVDQRLTTQGDVRERLGPAATRVIDTGGSAEEAERRVDEAYRAALHASRGSRARNRRDS
jgi:dephospho-CoA kinase